MTHDVPVVDADLRSSLAGALVDALITDGALRSERWIRAFRAVPRDAFVPCVFVDPQHDGRYEPLNGARPGQRHEWLELVYCDEPLVVQVDGATWLSSSSQPSLMARMLEALAVTGAERVLEIGTGTGYNAALLCQGLGSGQVTSVDIDAGLVGRARTRLRVLGFQPAVAVADGSQGWPSGAPYDRIMATCSMPSVPAAWISQCASGALIMVNLYRELGGGALALLTADGAGPAAGSCRSAAGSCPLGAAPIRVPLTCWTRTGPSLGSKRRSRSRPRCSTTTRSACWPRCASQACSGSAWYWRTTPSKPGCLARTDLGHARTPQIRGPRFKAAPFICGVASTGSTMTGRRLAARTGRSSGLP